MNAPSRPACPHCGRPLPVVAYEFAGIVRTRPGACGCPEARRVAREQRAAEAEEERRRAEGRMLSRMRKASIPPRFFEARPERPAPREGCWIFGPNRTGKTEAAAAMAIEAIRRGICVRFSSLREIAGEMNDARAEDRPARSVFMKYAGCGLLVLDDLGKENFTPAQIRTLFEILDWRWSHRLPTVVTSNFSPARLVARIASVDASTARAVAARVEDMEKRETRPSVERADGRKRRRDVGNTA